MKKFIQYSLISYLFFTSSITCSPSQYDASFGNSGTTGKNYAANTINQALDIKAQANGKIVSVGSAGENGIIIRYNQNGSPDLTFNETGQVIVNLGTPTALFGLAIQPTDQKIIAVGYVIRSNVYNVLVVRYNTNGTLDTTFNGTGYITTLFQTQSQLFGIALQRNGSIVVAGWATEAGLTQALVARYTNNGILDTTFGDGYGYTTTLIGEVFTRAQDVIIQPNGQIIITGQAQIEGNQGLIVIRFNTDGSQDTSFNSNTGYAFPCTDFLTSQGNSLALGLNGKIVIVGYTSTDSYSTFDRSYTVLRLNTDGRLDETFNNSGFIVEQQYLQAQGVVIQANGQIVTCGFNYTSSYIPVVIRYNTDGSADPTFDFISNQNTQNSLGNAITLQIDGKIIVTGTIQVPEQA